MPRASVPTYRLHRPSNQAVVTIRTAAGDRRDVYLGPYDSPESRREYARVIAEQATDAAAPAAGGAPDLTIDQILVRFWKYAEEHYRGEDGKPTNQVVELNCALRHLHQLYGHVKAADFGPLALKAVRQKMIEAKWCRNQVNSRVGKVKRLFKWAASEQLVSVTVFQAIATVEGLKRGRTEAEESEPVGPVAAEHVDATLPYLNRHVWGLVQFTRYTGCRPGEACLLRKCDIDVTREVWFFTPRTHKTAYQGKGRTVAIGPRAQEVLKQFFTSDSQAYLFNPQHAVEEHHANRTAARRTPLYPSHVRHNARRKAKKPRKYANRYTTHAFAVTVKRAVERLNRDYTEAAVELELHVPHWHPNQLRHSFATAVRRKHDLEHAGAALGHTRMSATQVYAERDQSLAARVAAEMG